MFCKVHQNRVVTLISADEGDFPFLRCPDCKYIPNLVSIPEIEKSIESTIIPNWVSKRKDLINEFNDLITLKTVTPNEIEDHYKAVKIQFEARVKLEES